MKRKLLFRVTAVVLAIASLAATIVVKISEFPAVTTPADTDLLLLASGATNKNITFANFRNAIGGTSGTAVNNIYVTNISVTNINVQNVTLKGKSIAETYVNATDVLRPNFKDGAAITFVVSATTNITPTLGALTGDVTTSANGLATTIANSAITDAKVSSSAAIARSKLAAGTANHILINDGSGVASSEATLGAARFPALSGDVTTPGGSLASTIAANAVTDAKFRQGVARSVVGVTGNATANTADIQGTADQVLRVNGAGTALGFGAIDLSKTAAVGGVLQAASFSPLTGDVTTSAGSLATTAAATLSRIVGTEVLQNKTITTAGDGGNNTLKTKSYLILAGPHSCDGVGAIIYTNDNTKAYFGQAAFSGSAAATANFVEYRITVPEDIDTSVNLKVERFKFRLGAADTGAHSYVISQASVADSASHDSPTLGQSVTLSFAGDASGASGEVETISSVTLTNWLSNVTAGQLWVIRLARNGDTDASTQVRYSGPVVISYGATQ